MDAPNGHLYSLRKLTISSRECLNSARVPSLTANPTLPFLFVVNPSSGPGSANTQPDSNYQTCIAELASNANARVLGYVATGQGTRSSSDVTTDIATYAQWDAAYRPTGIFFDETEATTDFVSLYQSYANAVHSSALGSSAFVCPTLKNSTPKLHPARGTDFGCSR